MGITYSRPIMKVTYHQDGKRVNKYINEKSAYQEIYDKILESGPFSCCSKTLVMHLYWIDNGYEEILLESQEDFDIFLMRTSALQNRNIHAKLLKPGENMSRSMFSD